MKILIAEADRTSCLILETILTESGFEVVSTSNGLETLEQLQLPDSPKLAIINWLMPEMDGIDVCCKIRQQKTDDLLYIILLAAQDNKSDIVVGLDIGANDYITKPYDQDELYARIRVGQRVLELQAELKKHNKLQGALELVGRICHELNQPLQSTLGCLEILLMGENVNVPPIDMLKESKAGIDKIIELTSKIQGITNNALTHIGDKSTVDIHASFQG